MPSVGWLLSRGAIFAILSWISASVQLRLLYSYFVTFGKSLGLEQPSTVLQDEPKEEKDFDTVSLEGSAFDTDLYHVLKEPYKSFLCMPTHIHTSQESNVDITGKVNMTVSFTLDYESCAHVKPYVVVKRKKYTAPERLQFNFTSTTTGEFYASDWIFHVSLPHLQAGRTHDYSIQVHEENLRQLRNFDGAVIASSPKFSLVTPPLPHTPTTIAIVGDLGQTHNSTLTMSHILRATTSLFHQHPVSLLHLIGDFSYADSEPRRWPTWMELMEPLLRRIPLHGVAGNHEIECDAGGTHQVFQAYENYFRNPNRVGAAQVQPATPEQLEEGCSCPSVFLGNYDYGNAFYSYTHGLMKMIVLNSYTDSTVGSVQYKWLQDELSSFNRDETPWLIVTFHAPFYNTFNNHKNETESFLMQQAMEPLFVEHNVNLVISGHIHAYMRSHPMRFGHLDVAGKAPIHIVVGTGGNREGHNTYGYIEPKQDWVAARDTYEFGYAHLHMPNMTHAHWSWVRDGTTDEGIHDTVWITNPHV